MATLGASVTLAAAFTVDDVAADPSALVLEIVDPAGATTTLGWPIDPDPEVIDAIDVGSFEYVFTPDQVGVWRWRWLATDVLPEAIDGEFEVTSVFEPQTYATLERVLMLFGTNPSADRLPDRDTARRARLAQALHTATDELVEELSGRDFFRHPSTGTETWSPSPVDIDGRILHCHQGLLTVTSVAINGVAVAAEHYALRGSAPSSPVAAGEPAFHIELLRGRWSHIAASNVITGARGWPAIPPALAESCAARARQIAFGDGAYQGTIAGPDGDIPAPDRWPQVFYRFLVRERGRFSACLFSND